MEERKCPVREGDSVTLTVSDLGVHGEGIGKYEGFTIFVPGALPGETARAKISLVKRAYAVGNLSEIEEISSARVTPSCPVYEECGGCQISHLSYEAQLAVKRKRVADVLARIGGYPAAVVHPVLGAAHPVSYRNKMAVPVGFSKGRPALGYYRRGSHDIIPTEFCEILREGNNRLLAFAKDFVARHHISPYDEKTGTGSLRHILGRTGDGGRLMAVIVTATETLPFEKEWISELTEALPECVSIYHNVQPGRGNVILGKKIRRLWGEETLTATLCGLTFSVSPFSFFQINPEQAEILYETALAYANLSGSETVIDAYCGTGTITLALARRARRAVGIEIVAPAIADAKKNAARNGIANAEFYAEDAARLMPRLAEEGLRPDVIVMDPVRAGCDEKVLEAAAAMSPARIVYVSCNPATFARDAARLRDLGYILREVTPVDMFPQTMHVEVVGVFEKGIFEIKMGEKTEIRYATKEDIGAVAAVEAACFPPAEAAKEADFVERVTQYGNHFWLMFDGAKLIAFADGFVTDEADLTDDMYHDAFMHNENGAWQMIFGVNTIPAYRRRGYAETLLRRAIEDARKQGRKGLVLTCKDALVPYYAKFGFRDEGISEKSTHGNVVWHQMRLQF